MRIPIQLIGRCADLDPSRCQFSHLNPKAVGRLLKSGGASVSVLCIRTGLTRTGSWLERPASDDDVMNGW